MSGRRAKRERRRRTLINLAAIYGALEHEKLAILQQAAARNDRIGATFWQSQRRPPCP
jgi:hypothetical protein